MQIAEHTSREATVVDGAKQAGLISVELRRAARRSRQPVSVVTGGGGFKARKGDRWYVRLQIGMFLILFAIPAILAGAYFGLVASDQYVTQVRLTIRESSDSITNQLAGIFGVSGGTQQYEHLLKSDILSRDMYDKVAKSIDLQSIFSSSKIDFIARSGKYYTEEEMLKYWMRRIDVNIEDQTSIMTIDVYAFTPEDSYKITKIILKESEELLNGLTIRVKADALKAAEAQRARAEDNLRLAANVMLAARNQEGMIDGISAAKGVASIVSTLTLMQSDVDSLLDVAKSSGVQPDSPQIRVIEAKRQSLMNSISRYQDSIAADHSDKPTIATRMASIDAASIAQKVAQSMYVLAAETYETARMDALNKSVYLVPFIQPALPQGAEYPKRFWGWMIISLPALLLWGIIAGVTALVRDHMAA